MVQSPKRSVRLHDGTFGYAEVIAIKVIESRLATCYYLLLPVITPVWRVWTSSLAGSKMSFQWPTLLKVFSLTSSFLPLNLRASILTFMYIYSWRRGVIFSRLCLLYDVL